MIEKQGKLSVTLVISALAVFIGYVINFLLTPYVTDRLGIEIYGFVSIAKNIVGYAGIVTIALTAFVVRFISVSYHKGNYEEAKSYYSSSIAASIVLSGSIFLIAAIIILKLEYLLNIPENSVVSIKILFLIVFLTFVVTTMTTPFSAAAFIKNKLDMDQMMVDITDIPDVKLEDIVTLIGKDGDNSISVEDMANLAGSFNYEFVCDVGKRVPRVYIK